MALVSVIIPCFNAELWIRETLQSVLVQVVSGKLKLLLETLEKSKADIACGENRS